MRTDAHYEYKYAHPIPMINKYSSEKKKKKKNKRPYVRLLFARKNIHRYHWKYHKDPHYIPFN